MNASPLQLDKSSPFASIVFDQPDSKVNVLTRDMWHAFHAALQSLSSRDDLRGLILRSAKPGLFLAGADLKELYPRSPGDRAKVEEFIELGKQTLDLLESLPFPTAALIDGVCLGGGLEVALACDLCLEGNHPKKRIGFPEVQLGLIPGWGGTQRLSRLYGIELASEMIGTGEPRETLFETCLESSQLLSTAQNLLSTRREALVFDRKLKFSPVKQDPEPPIPSDVPQSHAFQAALRVLREGARLPLQEALRIERSAFLDLVPSAEAQRLIGEFLNRKPRNA